MEPVRVDAGSYAKNPSIVSSSFRQAHTFVRTVNSYVSLLLVSSTASVVVEKSAVGAGANDDDVVIERCCDKNDGGTNAEAPAITDKRAAELNFMFCYKKGIDRIDDLDLEVDYNTHTTTIERKMERSIKTKEEKKIG